MWNDLKCSALELWFKPLLSQPSHLICVCVCVWNTLSFCCDLHWTRVSRTLDQCVLWTVLRYRYLKRNLGITVWDCYDFSVILTYCQFNIHSCSKVVSVSYKLNAWITKFTPPLLPLPPSSSSSSPTSPSCWTKTTVVSTPGLFFFCSLCAFLSAHSNLCLTHWTVFCCRCSDPLGSFQFFCLLHGIRSVSRWIIQAVTRVKRGARLLNLGL